MANVITQYETRIENLLRSIPTANDEDDIGKLRNEIKGIIKELIDHFSITDHFNDWEKSCLLQALRLLNANKTGSNIFLTACVVNIQTSLVDSKQRDESNINYSDIGNLNRENFEIMLRSIK